MKRSEGNQPRYYVAYGANLNLPRMMQRCPTAKVVSGSVLRDWQLRFRGTAGNGVATIERKKNCTVPVLIFEVQPKDEKALDGYEGYPVLYRKEQVVVLKGDEPIVAFTYIMNEDNHPYNQPGCYYFSVVLAGYLLNDFDVAILQEAVERNLC